MKMPDHPTQEIYPDLTMLQSIIVALSTKLDVDEILSSGSEVLTQFLGVNRTTAWVLNDDHQRLRHAVTFPAGPETEPDGERNDPEPPAPSLLRYLSDGKEELSVSAHPWLQRVLDAQELLVIENLVHDKIPFSLAMADRIKVAPGTLIVPILINERCSGLFELCSTTARPFSPQERSLAQSISLSVGTAIETGKHYQRLQNYAEYLDNALAQRTLELRSERDRTNSILEALGEAVFVTDLDGRIQYVNPAATDLTGYSREELVGQRMRLWRSQRQTAEFYTQMLHTIQDGQNWRGEIINTRKDGSPYDAAMTVAPLIDPNSSDRAIGFVSVQRDITPIKEAQNLKDQFVSNVSHELRTPVSVITLLSGNLDTLYDRLDDEKKKKLVSDIRAHTQVLNDLISSVLEISRIDSGQTPSKLGILNLSEILEEEAEKQRPLAESNSLSIELRTEKPLPVRGNEGQLRRVIRNLINNAIKYSYEDGRIIIEAREFAAEDQAGRDWPGVEGETTGPRAAFRIIDEGVGISERDQKRLFERFYRVDSQGNIPGAGLGLSIAQDLIQLHKGNIAVSSTLGKGSIFAVYIPLHQEGISNDRS